MTGYCTNPKCPLGLHVEPIGSPWMEVKTPEYGPIYMGHQIVAGQQYCDHCAREKRFGVESERVKFESEARRIASEKAQKKVEALQETWHDAPPK